MAQYDEMIERLLAAKERYRCAGMAFDRDRILAREAAEALAALQRERAELEAKIKRLNGAHWFYLGNDCESEKCRFSLDECIDEDFEWENKAEGDHVLQISGARPVPDMWLALHYFTEEEMDARNSDDKYTYTVHSTEDDACQAIRSLNTATEKQGKS